MKVYIAAGCAGGIAGMFNAPIAGIFFAAEIVLLGTYEISSFAALVIASAMSTVVTRGYYGEVSAFTIPQYHGGQPLCRDPALLPDGHPHRPRGRGSLSGSFTWSATNTRHCRLHPQLKPLTGALLIGCIGMAFPQVMGDGYDYMEEVLHGQGIAPVMFALIFLKILATSITLGSGGAGGVFAPSLFIGAVLGGSLRLNRPQAPAGPHRRAPGPTPPSVSAPFSPPPPTPR